MSKRIAALSALAATALTAIGYVPATAGTAAKADTFSIPAVIGAAYNSAARADSAVDVQRQGGSATAGTVHWVTQPPVDEAKAQPVFNSPGVIGAMTESRSLARSADEVRRQGGFTTAAAVHWLVERAGAKKIAAF